MSDDSFDQYDQDSVDKDDRPPSLLTRIHFRCRQGCFRLLYVLAGSEKGGLLSCERGKPFMCPRRKKDVDVSQSNSKRGAGVDIEAKQDIIDYDENGNPFDTLYRFDFTVRGEKHSVRLEHSDGIWRVMSDSKVVSTITNSKWFPFTPGSQFMDFSVLTNLAAPDNMLKGCMKATWFVFEGRWDYDLRVNGLSVAASWCRKGGGHDFSFPIEVVGEELVSNIDIDQSIEDLAAQDRPLQDLAAQDYPTTSHTEGSIDDPEAGPTNKDRETWRDNSPYTPPAPVTPPSADPRDTWDMPEDGNFDDAQVKFVYGQKVERRFTGQEWGVGYVVSVEPLMVSINDDPTSEAFLWDEVREPEADREKRELERLRAQNARLQAENARLKQMELMGAISPPHPEMTPKGDTNSPLHLQGLPLSRSDDDWSPDAIGEV